MIVYNGIKHKHFSIFRGDNDHFINHYTENFQIHEQEGKYVLVKEPFLRMDTIIENLSEETADKVLELLENYYKEK